MHRDGARRVGTRRVVVAVVTLLVAAAAWTLPGVACASFTAAPASSTTVGSGTLAAASGPAVTLTCSLSLIAQSGTVNWTASPTARATYRVTASATGAGTVSPSSQTVSGTSASLTFGGLAGGVTVSVTAVLGGWTSSPVSTTKSC